MAYLPDLYRIVKHKHAGAAFDGEGAKRYGGRWNSKGIAMVYTADSISLAALELLVHLYRHEIMAHYIIYEIRIDTDQILALPTKDRPEDWQEDPAPPSTAAIGDEWITGGTSLALFVPSVIVPEQGNFLLNPAHPDFAQAVTTAIRRNFVFDHRLAH